MNITDQIGQQLTFKETPKRIISLVPSQTELLYDLGLDKEVVGITKFCIHPNKWFKSKSRVGGTKNINFDKITALKPDLIIANKEENTQAEIEHLQQLYPVFTSNISNLEESLVMMNLIGDIVGKPEAAHKISTKVVTGFNQLNQLKKTNKSVLYLIWKDPLMSIGKNTFIDDMLTRCGFQNAMQNKNRYPEVTQELLKTINPAYVFLSSEPYPFKAKHVKEIQKTFPKAQIILVDGECFSWYGSRLIQSSSYFIDLINKLT